jgi:hypothetical protein
MSPNIMYIKSYNTLIEGINTEKKYNSKMQQILQHKSEETRGLTLESFVNTPVRRIPKYVLLLKEMHKSTANPLLKSEFQKLEQSKLFFSLSLSGQKWQL